MNRNENDKKKKPKRNRKQQLKSEQQHGRRQKKIIPDSIRKHGTLAFRKLFIAEERKVYVKCNNKLKRVWRGEARH